MGIMISVEEVMLFESFSAKEVSKQDATLLQAGIQPEEQDMKIREFLNINGQKAQAILKETGCSERKEYYYEEEEEGYCASMDLESDDESIVNLVSNRFKEIEIRPSEKSLRKQEKSSAPIDNKEIQKGNSLQDLIHATKKLNKHEKMQSDQQHILGIMQINYTATKEEMLQKINDDVINLNVNFTKIERFVNQYHHYEKQISIPKHMTSEMMKNTIKDQIGEIEDLNFRIKDEYIDVDGAVRVNIPDMKFKSLWSIACNDYQIELQQPEVLNDREIKIYNKDDNNMEGIVFFENYKDREAATRYKINIKATSEIEIIKQIIILHNRGEIWENGVTDIEEIVIRSKNAGTERIEKEEIGREEWTQVNIDILKENQQEK
ncbi:hypothetical protein C1645_826549 [Glomus cerebriforme]|uniref:Uncharacterized protein n=1 Tax=Glomus cerebriforme TaxID=658196 RepID=A0A397SZF0_9GLOM|nr:hypothetical protein C1645_826549 [Glomus cerebriforme]